jgi:O-glycosyl hydrolase
MRAVLSLFAVLAGFSLLSGCGGSSTTPPPPPVVQSTTTVLTATPNPVAAGATVTLTATVSSTGGTPTGSVTFLDGTTSIGTATLANGTATITVSTLAAGTTHSLSGSYAGSVGSFSASTSAVVSLAVNAAPPAATTLVLAAAPNPAAAGASVTLTATISSTGGVPSGSIQFFDGTTSLGTATLTSGVASLTVSTLSAGSTHALTASFAGSASFAASTSASVALVVNAAVTTTVLTATPNPAAAGANVVLTATVTSTGGAPTGNVSFFDGTTNIGTAVLTNGVASLTVNTLSAGATHSLTASYAGTSSFATSTSGSVALVVNATATITVLTATPNPVAASANAVLTATVSSTSGTPTGNVSFFDGTTNLGTVALANGVASLTVSTLSAGATHTLTAVYAGTTSYLTSTSAAVALVVNAAVPTSTTTVLTATPNPATAGATVTLTATVTSGNTQPPTGSVSFYDATTLLGTGTLTAGTGNTATAVYTTTTLAAATHNLTATFAGSTNFTTSTSTAVALVVTPYTANAAFSFTTPNQTIVGFGGAEAFYANYLDSHPYESQIMKALFDPTSGLGITFLRLQNNYYNYNGSNATTFDPDDPKIVTAATAALGSPVSILMSSWTPPASLKSNNSVNGCTTVTSGNCTGGFGTLAQISGGGGYNYAGFGQFWLTSLQAYAALGVTPNYISIQNEPDFPATYVACLFNPTEAPANLYNGNQSYASYGMAFDATYKAINGGALASVPQMIGPESFSLFNVKALLTQVPTNELAVVAHHLYNVSSYGGNPATQVPPMTTLDTDYPSMIKFETEYYQTPGFNNAIDIHNALTVANDSAYIYWGLTWPSTLANGISTDQQGLLYIDNPFNAQSTWAYPTGWTYNDAYYTLKHYSFFIRPGYTRYNATVSNTDEDISVYQSPDMKTTVIVILNTSASVTDTVGLDLSSITYTNSAVYRSSFATPITTTGAERWGSLGAYTTQGISMPPQSEVTVVLTQ